MEKGSATSGSVPGFEEVLALREAYGDLSRIPDEELSSVGYYRAIDGTVAPIGHEVMTLENKNANKPFEAFSVEISTTKTPRHLNDALVLQMQSIGEKIEPLWNDNTELDVIVGEDEANNLRRYFDSDLSEYGANDLLEKDIRIESLYFTIGEVYPSPANHRTEILRILNDLLVEMRVRDYGEEGADDKYRSLLMELSDCIERERGISNDKEELYRRMDEYLGFNIPILDERFVEYMEGTYSEDDEMKAEVRPRLDYLYSAGIDTLGKLLLVSIGHYLDEKFPRANFSYVNETMNLSGSKQASSYISELEKRLQAQAKRDFVEAKIRLSHIPYGSEGRIEAEAALAKAKGALKNTHKQLLPLLTLFDIPNRYSNKAKRYYDEMEEVLFASGKSERVYTFVSDIDTKRDANPGKVSGDCTEDEPLPFLDPSNSLYNVKVFRDKDDKHVGNIYLLEVRDQHNKPIAWHLDAIQIPQYIDWSDAAPKMLEGFKKQALVRGIRAITINAESHLISNYDYVADAFRKLVVSKLRQGSNLDKMIFKAVFNIADTSSGALQADHERGLLRLL